MPMSAVGRIELLTGNIQKLSDEFTKQQLRLATGMKAQQYSGLDIERVESLAIRSRLSEVKGYRSTLSLLENRLEVTSTVLNRMSDLRSETRSEMFQANYETINTTQVIEQKTADSRFQEMIEHFNRRIGGRYIFGGAETKTAPTETYDVIMNGDPVSGKDGFKTVLNEFLDANVGPSTTQANSIEGRLQLETVGGTQLVLQEDSGNDAHPFGLKIHSFSNSLNGVVSMAHTNAGGLADGWDVAPVAPPAVNSTDLATTQGLTAGTAYVLTEANGTTHSLDVLPSTTMKDVADFVNASGVGRMDLSGNTFKAEWAVGVTSTGATAATNLEVTAATATGGSDQITLDFTNDIAASRDAGITINFTLGDDFDGGIHSITLYPGVEGTTENDEFAIDADHTVMADNFKTALRERIAQLANVELRAKASFDAANAFFEVDGTGVPQRLDTTNGTVAASDVTGLLINGDGTTDNTNNTVKWYKGDPTVRAQSRSTVQVRLDSKVTVSVGMQANEQGFTNFLKPLAVLAVSDLSLAKSFGDTNKQYPVDENPPSEVRPLVNKPALDLRADFYTSLRMRVGAAVPINDTKQTIEQTWQDITTVQTIITSTDARHKYTEDFSKNSLADLEQASQEEAAARLLTIQNRLEASFATTARLQGLSLVNYLR